MGVKSTVELTRKKAEEKAVELFTITNRRKLLSIFVTMEDRELEDWLEHAADEAAGGESYENYIIVGYSE